MTGVSVIIPCYNGERYLRAAIESALCQDFSGPIEILVGDDGSKDASAEIAESFGPPVRVVRHAGGVNRGLPATRNLAIRAAANELIAFLDADDLFLPGHLRALAEVFIGRPELGLAFDNGYHTDSSGRRHSVRLPADFVPRLKPEQLLTDQYFPPCAVMVRKTLFEQVGLFDESLSSCEDHDAWLRVMERYEAGYVKHIGYMYRIHEAQVTQSLERSWRDASRVLQMAADRYPYPAWAIRRRKAVIAFRMSQASLDEGRPGKALAYLSRSVLCDPARAAREAITRLKRVSLRGCFEGMRQERSKLPPTEDVLT
jgi:glycosyltransferase involved in cell wall biosynthesis